MMKRVDKTNMNFPSIVIDLNGLTLSMISWLSKEPQLYILELRRKIKASAKTKVNQEANNQELYV